MNENCGYVCTVILRINAGRSKSLLEGQKIRQRQRKEIDINDASSCSHDGGIPELLKNMEVLNSEGRK